jgi:hypothetical protein
VTGEWDGTHNGDAEITGTLTIKDATNLEFVSAGGFPHGSITNDGIGGLTLDGPSTGSLNVGSDVSSVVMNASGSVTMQVYNGFQYMRMIPSYTELYTAVLFVSGSNSANDEVGLQHRPATHSAHNRYTAMGYSNTYSGSVLTAGAAGVGGDNKLIFQVSNDTFSEFPCAAFDHSGNLGVATLNPSYKLEVVGDISGSTFYGDGSGLTGVTGEWDGTHNGDAEITGTLTIKDATNLQFVSAGGFGHGSISNDGAGTLTLDGPSGGTLNIGSAVTNLNLRGEVYLSSSNNVVTVQNNLAVANNVTASGIRGLFTDTLDISANTANLELNASGFGIQMNTNTVFVSASMEVSGTATFLNNITASGHVSASAFFGDGTGLTGVTAEWDGTHNGDAEITGTLTIQDATNLQFVSAGGFGHGSISNNGIGGLTLDGPSGGTLNVGSAVTNLNLNAAGVYLSASNNVVTVQNNLAVASNVTASGIRGLFTDTLDISANTSNLELNASGFGIYMNTNTVFASASMEVSGSTKFGNLSTDTHNFTGSVTVTGPELEVYRDAAGSAATARFENVNAAGNTYIETHGTNQGGLKMYRGGTLRATVDTGGNAFTMYSGDPLAANVGFQIASQKAEFKDNTGHSFGGTKAKLNISASSGPLLRADAANATTSFLVDDLLTMDDTTTPATPTSAAQLYAKSGQLYTQNDDGIESLVGQEMIAMSKIETVADTVEDYDIHVFSSSPTNTFQAVNWTIDGSTRYVKSTFTAPANGQAKVTVSTFLKDAGGTSEVWFGLHNASTDTTTPTYGWFQVAKDSEAGEHDLESVSWVLTGLTPGASITVYLHAICTLAGSQVKVGRQSPSAWSNNDLPRPTTISVHTIPVTIDVNPT